MKHNTFITAFISFLLIFSAHQNSLAQSVLSKGDFFPVKIPQDGIYKITAQNLQKAGWDLNKINPKNIAIFGNKGGMLPQANNAERDVDLSEIPIFVKGEEDGKFDNEDFILFFAAGADEKNYSAGESIFKTSKNIYEDFNYCFLTHQESAGKRIETAEQPAGGQVFDYFDEHFHHEKDEFNVLADAVRSAPGGSGREWFGEFFDLQTSHQFEFDIKGINNKKNLRLNARFMAFSVGITNIEFAANGKKIGSQAIPASYDNTYSRKGNIVESIFSLNANDFSDAEKITFTASFTKNEQRAFAAADFLALNYTRDLRFFNNEIRFRLAETANFREAVFSLFGITQPEKLQIWDISDLHEVKKYTPAITGEQGRFAFHTGGQIREFIALQGEDFPQPDILAKIPNQNIKGEPVPNFIIISHKDFIEEAKKLADFRAKNDGLSVLVLDVEQIYREFSSGRQDVSAIRDCIRFFYQKNSSVLQYVLLFGDASYDYRGRMAIKSNFVPIYQSRESLHPIFSFSSEDYFGMTDENEGEWIENNTGETDLEIPIGRIPVRNLKNAEEVVNKIIAYSQADALGEWRKKICLVADDGDRNLFQEDSEKLADYIDSAFSAIHVRKVYIDAFEQTSTGNGKRALAAQEKLNQYAENGALIVNFMGHGSEIAWTQETVLDITSILAWNNGKNLPFFFTGTCEFGRYDNPYKISGGEWIITSQAAGIGLLTTTRPVFAETNFTLAKNFYANLFSRRSGKFLRLGDIFKLTKNNSLNLANRNFALLGDPSMRLAYPQDDVFITNIKDRGQSTSQLKALSRAEITAEIRNNNVLTNDFNGFAEVTVFDKAAEISTLGDESPVMNFFSYDNVIFKGIVPVRNGLLQFSFVVPKDINYKLGEGKISIYAFDSQKNRDAVGAKNIIIGGSSDNAASDNQPPKIRLFIGNDAFVSGQKVPASTQMLAFLSDENGINTTGIGIGHDILAELTGAENKTFILNELYQTTDGDFTKGQILLPLNALSPGKYSLKLSAFDTYNNLGTANIEFEVENQPIDLKEVMVFPNPVKGGEDAVLRFTHDREGDNLRLTILTIDNTGRAVRKQVETYSNVAKTLEISLKTLNNDNERLAKSMYILKILVQSQKDGSAGLSVQKLVID